MADADTPTPISPVKRFLRALVSFQGTPHEIALAFSLGLALGVLPGTGAAVAAGLAVLLRLNLPLMVVGALFTNPFTMPFIYAGSYALGVWLLGRWLPAGLWARLAVGTVTGGICLALTAALLAYPAVVLLVLAIRARFSSLDKQPPIC